MPLKRWASSPLWSLARSRDAFVSRLKASWSGAYFLSENLRCWDRDVTRHGFQYKSDRHVDGGLGFGWRDAEFNPARHGMFLEPRS